MHPTLFALDALELARERSHDAERRVRLLRGIPLPAPRSARARRALARAATHVSNRAADLARRLEGQPEHGSREPQRPRLPA